MSKRYLISLALVLVAAGFSYRFFAPRPATVVKSPMDSKLYRSLVLDNGLKVLLVSNPKADQAAASLAVSVGQFQDPAHRQGLAHYLEHMLFLGNQAYPDPEGFGKFLSENGGSTNAFTALEDTNFHFVVNRDHLQGALERFSQFFISPLFTAELAGREVNAVNSEHQKNLQNDFRRMFEVQKSGFNPEHPMSRFGTGSLESLGGENLDQTQLQKDLRQFFETQYSADKMSLALLGVESLDQLEAMARGFFSAVPRKVTPKREYLEIPPVTAPLPRLVKIEPVQEQRWLKLSWVIDSQKKNFRSRPGELISHLLGHEGPGSLLSYYKAQGWAAKLTASPSFNTDDFTLFELHIEVTPSGLEHWPEMVETAFAFLKKIEQTKAQDLQTYQDELDRIGQLQFKFLDEQAPLDFVTRLASQLQDVPAAEVLEQPYRYAPLKSGEVAALLGQLLPERLSVYLVAKGFVTDQTEPRYGTQYQQEAIKADLLARWEQPKSPQSLALAEPNPFIPKKVELVARDQTSDEPKLLADQAGLRVWFQQDPGFDTPKVRLAASIRSPIAYDNPRHAALTRLYTQLVQERMNEYAYAASLAGLTYRIQNDTQGLILVMEGYPDTLGKLFTRLLSEMRLSEVSPQRFELLKRELKEDRLNQERRQAFHRAIYEGQYLLSQQLWHNRDYLAVIDDLTRADLQDFIPQLLGALRLETLLMGNLNRDDALSLSKALQDGLASKPLGLETIPVERIARLPPGKPQALAFEVLDVNSAIEMVFQAGPTSDQKAAEMLLLTQILEKPFYHQLRTTEQLGYVVWSMRQRQQNVESLVLIIQSNVKRPPYLRQRILSFLEQFAAQLEQMPTEAFERHRKALAAELSQDPKNLDEALRESWGRIQDGNYDFKEKDRLIAQLDALSPPLLAQRLRDLVFSQQRQVLSVDAFAAGHKPRGADWPLIQGVPQHKLTQPYYPNPVGQPSLSQGHGSD
ncbi:MAG: insulinase family protein [bacterium]|nr:insulinase family protein [bacterium]